MNLEYIKKIHIVGVCGVATGSIAIALKKAGYEVSGSDKGFFPPVSDLLKKENINFYAGFHPEKMLANGKPDLVIIGNASGSQNPETLKIRELGIPELSDAEARGKFFANEENIVCAGTWGKTSTSAILSFILLDNHLEPSYITGGISLSHDPAHIGNGKFSVIEGDEYKTSPFDKRPKFVHFPPNHLVLTAVSWDHADMYKTPKSYFEAFENLTAKIPLSGILAVSSSNAKALEIAQKAPAKIITFGQKENDNYLVKNIKQDKNGLSFEIKNQNNVYEIKSPMIGTFQAENITGAFVMAKEVANLATEKIISSIAKFQGIKRRLQKRFENQITIIDDIAHSPEKSASTLAELRKIYSNKIIAVYEPNIGSRRIEIKEKYQEAFKNADFVFIPRLTKLKIGEEKLQPFEGEELAKIISESHLNVIYEPNDEKLVQKIIQTAKPDDIIVFLGSHSFRGMIEDLISKSK